jgi:dipeptidyl aminopeptidase/acylaminoacyl peptidase
MTSLPAYRKFVILSALSIAALALPAQTAPKRPMTFDDLMAMRRLGDTDVSPDGKWLVYSVTDVDLKANTKTAKLWIQPVAGGDARVLEGAQPGDGGARFSRDGKRVLFLSSRGGSQEIYVADFDGASGATSNVQSVLKNGLDADNALWAPDGKSIVFTAEVYPDCPAIGAANPDAAKCTEDRDAAQAASKVKARIFDHLLYRHWNAFTGDKRSHLFLLDVASGGIRDLNPNDTHDVPPFSLGGGGGFAFAPDSKELAFTENLDPEPAISTNADIFTLDLTAANAKPVKVSTSPGGDFNPAYSPDGKYLAWRSQARAGYESDKFRLVLFDRAAKTIKDLLSDFDRWVDEFAWVPEDSSLIYFTAADRGEEAPYAIKVIDGKVAMRGPVQLLRVQNSEALSGEYSDLHPTRGGSSLIASRMMAGAPSEVVTFETAKVGHMHFTVLQTKEDVAIFQILQESQVTHLNDALLNQLDLQKMESFWFTAADKTKVQGFVIRPPGFDAAKKYPVKFLIHGGPQGAWGDAWSYRWNAELLAANGYVVIMINPRGSTGYGQAFVDGVNGDWGGKPYSDLMLGLDYAEKTYPFIDKTRECALGASYGGYMANWILGHTNRFKCIVTHDGMFNPESAYGTTEEMWFNEWEFKGEPWNYYGKADAENPFRKWSPAMSAKNFKTPTLVIHSQLDYRLDVSEGYQLFDTLQRLKVPSRMLYFPDEGHWVMKPQNSELWYKTVNAWVDEWTGIKGQGSGISRSEVGGAVAGDAGRE